MFFPSILLSLNNTFPVVFFFFFFFICKLHTVTVSAIASEIAYKLVVVNIKAVLNLQIHTSYFSHVWIIRTNSSQRVRNSHKFGTDFEHIACDIYVPYQFIGSINAIYSHGSKYPYMPKTVVFLLHTKFSRVFHNIFNNFMNRNFEHVILYAYSGMLEFPGQVLELSMPVGRGTKTPPPPRPPVGSGMDG